MLAALAAYDPTAEPSVVGAASVVSVGARGVVTALGQGPDDANDVDVPQLAAAMEADLAAGGAVSWQRVTPAGAAAVSPAVACAAAVTAVAAAAAAVATAEGQAPGFAEHDGHATACPFGCWESKGPTSTLGSARRRTRRRRRRRAVRAAGSRVTIKRCRRVVVDIDIERVQLLSLVVWGELVIPDRGVEMRVAMRAICMRVKPGGRIVVGAPERPITGSVEFLLAGDELAEIAECDGMAGHRFDVEGASTLGGLPDGVPLPGGEVAMYGDTMEGPMWSKLRATAAAGDRTLILAGRLAFHPDDEVVIGTTAMDGSETERRTVASVRYLPVSNGFDTELTLESA